MLQSDSSEPSSKSRPPASEIENTVRGNEGLPCALGVPLRFIDAARRKRSIGIRSSSDLPNVLSPYFFPDS